jgi:hypothetical protein
VDSTLSEDRLGFCKTQLVSQRTRNLKRTPSRIFLAQNTISHSTCRLYDLLREYSFNDLRKYFDSCCSSPHTIYIVDEAQELLKKMANRYNSSSGERDRPLFRFLVDFIHNKIQKPSFWCGTHLCLENVELASSGMGGGSSKDQRFLFTNFHYYTFEQIQHILKVMAPERMNNAREGSKSRACYYLQGRPRFVTTFLECLKAEPRKELGVVLDEYVDDLFNDQIPEGSTPRLVE